jgi:hypothetical protein
VGAAEGHDPGQFKRGTVRSQRDVRGLNARGLGQQIREDQVDRLEDRGNGSEVLGERDRLETKSAASLVVDAQVGSAEPVDRLLGVADQGERAGADPNLGPPPDR